MPTVLTLAPLAAGVPSISVAVTAAAAVAAATAVATATEAASPTVEALGVAAVTAAVVSGTAVAVLGTAAATGVAAVTAAVEAVVVTVVAARRWLSCAQRVFCGGCAVGKGIRKAIARTTSSTAARPLQRFFADLAGPLPRSAAGSAYVLCIVDDCTNFGVLKFLKDKSAPAVCTALREFFVSLQGLRSTHGNFQLLRTDNGREFLNELVDDLLLEFGITRELTSPEGGQKRNGKVERQIGLIREGGRAAVEEAVHLFPDIRFPTKALTFDAIYPEAFAGMSDNINVLARLDQKPHMRCPYELLYGKRPLRAPLPFLMPGARASSVLWRRTAASPRGIREQTAALTRASQSFMAAGATAMEAAPAAGGTTAAGAEASSPVAALAPGPQTKWAAMEAAPAAGGTAAAGAAASSPVAALAQGLRTDVAAMEAAPARGGMVAAAAVAPSPVAALASDIRTTAAAVATAAASMSTVMEEMAMLVACTLGSATTMRPTAASSSTPTGAAPTRAGPRARHTCRPSSNVIRSPPPSRGQPRGAWLPLGLRRGHRGCWRCLQQRKTSTREWTMSGTLGFPSCRMGLRRVTPTTWAEAHSGEDSDIWYSAEDAEFTGLLEAETFSPAAGS
ncbi:unnamed protein product [Ectocarpus sp. CCAP 1310/34]|nr:unnamed protein product [Ectocarpus sp. CCAP 1310/34]